MLTYALSSQQQLIREEEVNKQNDDRDYSTENGASGADVDWQPLVHVTTSEKKTADDANDGNSWDDHAPRLIMNFKWLE